MRPPLARIFRRPTTSFIAGAVFLTSVVLLPVGERSPSRVGSALGTLGVFVGLGGGTHCVFPYRQRWYQPDPSGFTVVPESQLANAWLNPSCVLASVDVHPSGPSGLWCANDAAIDRPRVALFGRVAGSDGRELCAQYVNELVADGDPLILREMPGILTADVDRSTVIRSGWVHNAVSLVSFIVFTPWLLSVPRRIREGRRKRESLCPACSYDQHGTPPSSPCPECGNKESQRVE